MPVRIHVWSDYVCPFCYLEEPALERIRHDFGEAVEVRWHAFELRPEPVPTLDPQGEYLEEIWRRSVYPMARERGMKLQLPPVQPRSRLAHEAAQFAAAEGRFEAMNHALFKAFFREGRDIGDRAVLAEIGQSIGLDPVKLLTALEEGLYRQDVLADECRGRELGITAVPTLLVQGREESLEQAAEVSGAQPYDLLRALVEPMVCAGVGA